VIDFYTRTAIRLKKYQALFIAAWGVGILGGAMTVSSETRPGQLLFGFIFAPMFCFGWSLFLTCLWFHPAARAPGRDLASPSPKQLSRMAAIITLLIVCGALLGPASLMYSK
jgi:hypothetical protein